VDTDFNTLEQSCIAEGLLKPAIGGVPRITKKGREVVKATALVDDEVADALRDALASPLMARREALVSVLLLACSRRST
jgi:hypothetical protein